nr:uncharacterized protein K02A2.6-like [Lepeophtheirus salmonis]
MERVEYLKKEYKAIFEESCSHMKHIKVRVHLNENAHPCHIRAHPVPLTLREHVADELPDMVDRGTLRDTSRVESSQWASPIVAVLKSNGKVQICADFTYTISPIVDKHLYPIPHPYELFMDIAVSSYFSKLDFAHFYEQYALDDESNRCCVIKTPLGLFRYNILPYGLASAPTIVQAAQEKLLEGIPGVKFYIDDVLIFSKSRDERFKTLEEVYRRIERLVLV